MHKATHAGLLCLAIWLSPGVEAQSVAASDTASGLQEIIVTAARNESKAQETPIAVTALTGDTLREAGISDVDRLAFERAWPQLRRRIGRGAYRHSRDWRGRG
jgi:iron complex outermembrane receptor protein